MAGAHDMGGQPCHEPIPRGSCGDAVFDEEWHARTLALTLASGLLGKWNIDASRHARESLPRGDCLSYSYYEIWLAALAELLVSSALASPGELSEPGKAARSGEAGKAASPGAALNALRRGTPASRSLRQRPRFAAGQRVRARSPHTNRFVADGHTRLPAYAQGKTGMVLSVREPHVLPDSNAHFLGEAPEYLYSVGFAMSELWGEAREAPHDEAMLDLWESYLDSA